MSDSDSSDADFSSTAKSSILHEMHGQIAVEWEIKEFFDLPNKLGYFLDSPSFSLSRAKWFIRIYPNGNISEYAAYIVLSLCKKRSKYEHYVCYTIGIKKADGSVLKSLSTDHNFKQEENHFGWNYFYQRSKLFDLKDVLATDGVLTIFCSARLKYKDFNEAAVQTSLPNTIETLPENFKELFLSGTEGDVAFKVNDTEFVAHKLVLSARSKVFQAMFKTDMVEKTSGIVEIEDCDPACFKDFLMFVYSGKLDIVSSTNALGLYLLAEKYNLKELKIACSEYLSRGISVDSICDVVHLTSLHDEPELLETATEFFINHANAILATPKWFSFVTEHPTLANELLLKMANKYIK